MQGLVAAIFAILWASAALGQAVDFTREVQPILADKCYACHGPDANQRKGDLRFDVLDPKIGPLAARDGYAIVVPGNVDDSVMVMRITSDDPEVKMPPVKSKRTLSAQQIDVLQRWVKQGARWGKHWSLEAPKRPELPAVKDQAWVRNPIDRFILAKLEKEGLAPSPEASKEILLRRVTLDLTGVPPTLEEIDAFLADSSPDAYEKVVDRLLASPRYGERMAWEWLAAARYADTNGYQNDPTRTMWPWRDWVISALNRNMPFDLFMTWQIAGDLLAEEGGPHPGPLPAGRERERMEQKVASGFNRNHPFNGEGGRIPEETRVENVMDRVDTTATVFLGLTVGCAKCHDHKFDPISQKDYYSLYAYFNQCSETGEGKYVNEGNVAPVVTYTTEVQQAKLAALKLAAKEAADRLAAAVPKIDAEQAKWEASARYGKGWIVATPVSVKSSGGATLKVMGDSSVLASGVSPDNDVQEVVLRTELGKVTGLRLEVLPDGSLPMGGPGRSPESGNFVLTEMEGFSVSEGEPKVERLAFAIGEATYEQEGFSAQKVIDGDATTGWAVWKAPEKGKLQAVFTLKMPVVFDGAGGEIHLKFRYDSKVNKQHTMGKFRLALTDGAPMMPNVAGALASSERNEEQKKALKDFYQTRVSTEAKPLSDALAAANKAVSDYEGSFTKTMVMDDAVKRETHVLVKGAYDKPADEVKAGVPGALHPMPAGMEKNDRVALAKWLVDPANPLTARVIVNRYWQRYFGVGIVKTVDDFGVQGERPVNQELLDWLAVEFRDGGWDVKKMQRLMVSSAAYRQSSSVTPELHERDPENRLLARGPRFRLPSFVIRDQALAASGLLMEKVGGPPVKSYQPPGIWEEATFNIIKYQQDHGESLYRRSLYVFWRRIVGPTEFFDEASRSGCTVKPSRTNTPLQALTTLNDTTYVEAARALAERVMKSEETEKGRVEKAYRLVLGQKPNEEVEAVLTAAVERLRLQYAGDVEAAKKLLAVGESKRDEKLDAADEAAYAGVCLAILNLDEALTKE